MALLNIRIIAAATYFAVTVLLPSCAEAADAIDLSQTIELPDVQGRIDHLAVDTGRGRLFVAALGNNTLEVIDLHTAKLVHRITGLSEPQGVAFLSNDNLVAVGNGGDGTCRFFQADTFQPAEVLHFTSDVDNLRCDPSKHRLYVGYGSGGISIVDTIKRSKLFDAQLSGHPESFQFEQHGSRLFVNVPSSRQVAIADRESGKVTGSWAIENAEANFPMALDEDHHRLFVGCRKPAKVVVFDIVVGKIAAEFPTVGDTDDLFYDTRRNTLYVIGGEGFLKAYREEAGRFVEFATIPTQPGARTGLFMPSLERLYLAVPRRGSKSAEIRVYRTS